MNVRYSLISSLKNIGYGTCDSYYRYYGCNSSLYFFYEEIIYVADSCNFQEVEVHKLDLKISLRTHYFTVGSNGIFIAEQSGLYALVSSDSPLLQLWLR